MMKKILMLLFLTYWGLFFNYSPSKAVIHYVSTAGNDANSGTKASPWRTLQKAASSVSAGDIVYVRGGVYQETISVNLGGTVNSPVIFSSYPGEKAMIDGSNTLPGTKYSSLVTMNGSYIIFQNFEVKNSNGRGIQVGGSYNTVSGNNIHHVWDTGIYIYGNHTTVVNNRVWRAAESNYNRSNGDWSAGIAWGAAFIPDTAPNVVIRRNLVYQNSGEGIICMYTKDGLVDGNTVYDNWAMNIYIDQCSNVTVQKNLVYYTEDKQFWRNTTAPNGGITLANEGLQDYPIGHDRKVINNILVANGTNIAFWHGNVLGSALVNDLIAHNTLVNAYENGIGIDAGPHSGTQILNNIVFQKSGTPAQIRGTGIIVSHNLWYPLSGITGIGDVRQDPELVNPSGAIKAGQVNPVWYMIKDHTSPAVDAGINIARVATDFWGTNRSNPPDIGAHEYVFFQRNPWWDKNR